MEGEVPANLVDENGNGMIDEPGLYFTRRGQLITVGLTLSTSGPSGVVSRTWTGNVFSRN